MDTSQVMPRFGCNPGQSHNYWWGQEAYVTPCGVKLLLAGIALSGLIPGFAFGAVIAGADVGIAAGLSCNGSIYIDVPWGSPVPYVRPAC